MTTEQNLEVIARCINQQTEMFARMMEILEEQYASSKAREAEEAAHRAKLYDDWDKQVGYMAESAKERLFRNLSATFSSGNPCK